MMADHQDAEVKKWERDQFHDFVVTHGFGAPSEAGYSVGRHLIATGDDYATAAAEVVCRGLTLQSDEKADAKPVAQREPTPAVVAGIKSCTRGMTCPDCGSKGPFKVRVSGHVSVQVPSHETRGHGLEFDGGSDCVCEACEKAGGVRDFRPDTRGTYTAVLLYPDYATGDFGADIFVESAEASEPYQAAVAVQEMASAANGGDIPAEDFRVIAVFAGDLCTVLDATSFVPDGQSI